MSAKVQNLFNGIAHRYDFLNHFLSAGRDRLWRQKAADFVARGLRETQARVPARRLSLLDLCGGTGDFLQAVMQKLEDRTVPAATGMATNPVGMAIIGDFSLGMLKLSRQKFDASVKRMGVDALHPPFKPASFDAVFCGYGIRNLDDWKRGLHAVHDVLRPGGVFITLEFFRPETVFTRLFYGAFAPLALPLFGGLMSRKDAYAYLVESIRAFAPVSDYAEGCRHAGFEAVAVEACDFGITHIVVARKPLAH